MVGTDFRRCEAVSEGWHEHRAGKDVSPRQEPDAQRLMREITVFPALALTVTKNYKRHDLDACFGESVGFMERRNAERKKSIAVNN